MLRQTPLDFRAAVSYPFNLGYELNLCKMSDEEIEKISEQTALYQKRSDHWYRVESSTVCSVRLKEIRLRG